MNVLLKPAELLYRGINRLRRALYRRGVLRGRRLPRTVISIGNRAVGGSGKTPTTIAVARLLTEAGLRVAVLTRGYGREGRESGALIGESRDAARFGDEPVLLAASLPGVDVVVGRDRHASAMRYLAQHDCDLFLLDDGFQHLQLRRDLEIVIESDARWFREGRSSLKDAHFVLVRESAGAGRRHDPQPGPRSFTATLEPIGFVAGDVVLPLEALRGERVFGLAGLANNGQFFATLAGLGLEVAGRRGFVDHHRYGEGELASIREAAGGLRIVTTEKDLVKLSETAGIVALRVEMRIAPEEAFRSSLLQRIAATDNGRDAPR